MLMDVIVEGCKVCGVAFKCFLVWNMKLISNVLTNLS